MKCTLTLVVGFFFSLQLAAQNPLYLFPGWKIKHIGASAGEDKDMIHHLSHQYLVSTVRGDMNPVSIGDFDRSSMTSMICENPHLRLDVSLLPPGMRNTEMRLALVGIFNRIDEVNYMNGDYFGGDYESLRISSTASELGVEMSMLKHARLGNSLTLYGGAGTNLGYAFDGYVSVGHDTYTAPRDSEGNPMATDDPGIRYDPANYSYSWDSYKQRDGISQRLFAHAGAGIRFFKRVELGFEYRYGIGYRAIFGAPVVMTNLHSGALTARWLLK